MFWCLFNWHSWDNKSDGYYPPENKIRLCKCCKRREKWVARSLWLALQTDAPMGYWVLDT